MHTLSKTLNDRGLVFQHSGTSLEKITDETRTLYHGIDATAESLHIGNLLQLIAVKHFKDAGHKVVLLVGGGTSQIGDPSGKQAERPLLTSKEIAHNAKKITQQIEKIFGRRDFEVVNNEKWLSKLSLIEFLREVGKHFTINNMIQKETVRERIKTPEHSISFTEFTYSLLQAYDYFHLYTKKGCSLQIGGSDQWGNITAGIELIRRKAGAEVYGVTTPLVVDKSTGRKFGKSEGGAVWLDETMTSPYQFYQFWLNTDDASVVEYLKLYTFLPLEDISTLEERVKEEPHKREAQKVLAREVTSLVHGGRVIESIEKIIEVFFGGKSIKDLSRDERTMMVSGSVSTTYSEVPQSTDRGGEAYVVDALVATKLAHSKQEARQLIEHGSVQVNGEKVSSAEEVITLANFSDGMLILKKGKKDMHILYR